jgi:hypothetical protein
MLHACALLLAIALGPNQQIRGPEIGPALNRAVPLDGNHEVVVNLRFVDSGEERPGDRFFCSRPCRGNVHLLHPTCDSSCDGPCTAGGTHSAEVEPHRNEGMPNAKELATFGQALRTFGSATGDVEATCAILNHAAQDFHLAVAKTAITVNRECWVDKPCSYDSKDVALRYFRLMADWRLRRVTMVDGKPVYTAGPSGTLTLYEAGIPQRRTIESQGMRENCACQQGSVYIGSDGHGYLGGGSPVRPQTGGTTPGGTTPGGGTIPATGRGPTTGEFNDEPRVRDQGPPVRLTPKDPGAVRANPGGQVGFDLKCQNMNVASISGTNPFATDLTVRMNPGTAFDTDEDGIQDVILVMTYIWVLHGVDGEPERPRGPAVPAQAAQKPLQIMCLEMHKREPNPNVKFRLMPNPDPMLIRLASMVNPITVGVQDQTRIWVYTDGATYAQIAQKLVPAPTRGQYVQAVHDVKAAGSNLRAAKFNGCFEPANLEAPTDRRSAVKWYVEELLRRDAQGLLDWAAQRADFSKALAGDKKGESYAHIGRIARALYWTLRPDVQRAALLMLRDRVPESARSRLSKEDLRPLWSLARSADPELAKLAREVRELFA